MNKLLIVFILFFIPLISFSQNYHRIRVLEKGNRNPIQGALVFIEEIPLGDLETDINGFVIYQNLPKDRKVKLHARKAGYTPKVTEIVANPDIGADNVTIVELEKQTVDPSVIIWGYVTDANGQNVENANIDVNLAGKIHSVKSDSKGAYKFTINKVEFNRIISYRIIVESDKCDRFTVDKPIPNSMIVNFDIELQCGSLQEENSFNSNNYKSLDGVWEMSLTSTEYLNQQNIRIKEQNSAVIGIDLKFEGSTVSGRYLYTDGVCANASIFGYIADGNLELTVTHKGECCGGSQMTIKAEIKSQSFITGTYTPKTYDNPKCRTVWYSNILMKKVD